MNDPYVATPQGWRRKIGPARKYRLNDEPQNGEDGTLYGNHPGSQFTGQTKVGRPGARMESKFSVSLREARELSEANAALERREKQRTNQAKRAEAEKRTTVVATNKDKDAAAVASFGTGKAPAATQTAPAAPVMSREERNKIEEERRAKGRAKAEAERPGSLKAKLEEARSPAMRDDMTDAERKRNNERHLRQRDKKVAAIQSIVAESKARQASKDRSTGQEPKVSYSSPAPSGSNFGAARALSLIHI